MASAGAAAAVPGASSAAPVEPAAPDRPTRNDDGSAPLPPLSPPPASTAGTDACAADAPGYGASAGRLSPRSHGSIPVTGTSPLGTLRAREATGSPATPGDPIAEEMPLLGDALPADETAGGDAGGAASLAPTAAGGPPHGDVFLLLDLPDGATVGCDALAVGTGASRGCLGVRDFPPGPHFVWVSAPGAVFRCGYWFVTRGRRRRGRPAGAVRVKQWDRYNEVLGDPASHAEARAQRAGVAATYPRLVPYGFRGAAGEAPAPAPWPGAEPGLEGGGGDALAWRGVTSAITEAVLARVTGRTGVAEWLVDTSDEAKGEVAAPFSAPRGRFEAAVASELSFLFAPDDVDVLGRRLEQPRQGRATSPSAGAAGAAGAATDPTTAQVVAVLDNPASGITEADLVGELQLAFLTGLHLSNLACLEQWWHVVLRLVLRAHGLALARPALCRALLRTLHAQLAYSERYVAGPAPPPEGAAGASGGHGADGPATGIFGVLPRSRARLREALAAYKRRLDEALLGLGDRATAEQAGAGRAFLDLEAWLWRYGWDLRDGGRGGGEPARRGGDSDSDSEEEQGGEEGGRRKVAAEEDDDSDDEYRPVVVDLDEEGREVGMLSWDR